MTSVACMMQRGGNPWFRASRMACSSVTLRVQLLAREGQKKRWVITFSFNRLDDAESSCVKIIMHNIAPTDAIWGIQFWICQTYLSSHFTAAVPWTCRVCVWHNKNPSSVTAPSLTNSFSTRFRGNEVIYAADRDWGQWSQIETCINKKKNKSKPKLRIWWISGRIQYDYTASPPQTFCSSWHLVIAVLFPLLHLRPSLR